MKNNIIGGLQEVFTSRLVAVAQLKFPPVILFVLPFQIASMMLPAVVPSLPMTLDEIKTALTKKYPCLATPEG